MKIQLTEPEGRLVARVLRSMGPLLASWEMPEEADALGRIVQNVDGQLAGEEPASPLSRAALFGLLGIDQHLEWPMDILLAMGDAPRLSAYHGRLASAGFDPVSTVQGLERDELIRISAPGPQVSATSRGFQVMEAPK